MAEITIKSAPATFEAHGELASYFGKLFTENGRVIKVVSDVRQLIEDIDPEGNPIQSWSILGSLIYERGSLKDIPRGLFQYIGEFLEVVDQLNADESGEDN